MTQLVIFTSLGGWRAFIRLPKPKIWVKSIDCIFIGYVEHSKAYRFYVIEPNDNISVNSVIESRDAMFNDSLQYLDLRV